MSYFIDFILFLGGPKVLFLSVFGVLGAPEFDSLRADFFLFYQGMRTSSNPYRDGKACDRILNVLKGLSR